MKKNNRKYDNVITAFNSDAVPSMVVVIKSNDDLPSELIEKLKVFNIMLPMYIDEYGMTRANDIYVEDILLENIRYDNELTTCKFTINNIV